MNVGIQTQPELRSGRYLSASIYALSYSPIGVSVARQPTITPTMVSLIFKHLIYYLLYVRDDGDSNF